MQKKECYICKKTKHVSNFSSYKNREKYQYYTSYCKKCIKEYQKSRPWDNILRGIRLRCGVDGKYFKRGIKNFLTLNDIKELWFKEKAYLLKRPSIDRKNSKRHYTIKNCRFIELSENSRRGGIESSKVRRKIRLKKCGDSK